jgi:hypothetical protein
VPAEFENQRRESSIVPEFHIQHVDMASVFGRKRKPASAKA